MTGTRAWLLAGAAALAAVGMAAGQTAPATSPATATAPAFPGTYVASPLATTIGAALTLLGGLVACFYGLRCQKAVFAALGFIVGTTFVAAILLGAGVGPVGAIVAGLLGGVVGAMLMYRFYLLAVFLIGLTVGGSVLYAFLSAVVGPTNPATMAASILGAVFCGVAAVKLQKMTILLATAYGGALLAVMAVWTIRTAWTAPAAAPARLCTAATILAVIAWLALGTAGAVVQLAAEARRRGVSERDEGDDR